MISKGGVMISKGGVMISKGGVMCNRSLSAGPPGAAAAPGVRGGLFPIEWKYRRKCDAKKTTAPLQPTSSSKNLSPSADPRSKKVAIRSRGDLNAQSLGEKDVS